MIYIEYDILNMIYKNLYKKNYTDYKFKLYANISLK